MVKQGYKQTEIGVIPEDWEVKELNTLSKITRLAGYEYSTYWKEDRSGEIIGLRGFNIGKNKIIDREFSFISDSLSKKLNRSRLYKNDIIYPCVGTIGNACVITEDDKYHIQQNIAKITPNISLVYPYYLSHFLMSDFGLKEIERFNGSSSQPNVLVGSLRKYNIILPPLAEQEAIATALSDADAWIEHLEQLIAKKRLIKQGAMQELLTPPSPSSGNADGEALEPWEVKKLGEVFNIIKGQQFNSVLLEDDGDYPCYSGGISPSGYSEKYNETENTIIISEGGNSCGYVNFVKTKFWLGGHCYKVVFRTSKLEKQFTYHLLKFNQDKIMSLRVGSGLPNIQKKSIEDFEISFPSLSDQTRIASILSDMDAELEALEQQLDKARQIKQGMMQELLTGRIRL